MNNNFYIKTVTKIPQVALCYQNLLDIICNIFNIKFDENFLNKYK